MKLSDIFRFGSKTSTPAVEVKESAAAATLVMNPGQPVWSPRDYAAFAREAYSQNVVAYQAINKIAESIASVKLMAFKGEEELVAHPLLDLLARPNALQTRSEYITAKVSFLLIAGNGYEERIMVGKDIRELHQLRPDRMRVVMGASGLPQEYVYKVAQRETRWKFDDRKMTCDVRHLKLFNPANDFYGLSPIEATAYAVDQSNQGMAWLQALLQNSARPSGALVMTDGQTLSDDAFVRLKKQIDTQYSGAQNAGRPMLLEGGLDWKAMGLSPADMGIIEAKSSAARDICLGFGVPPQLLGIPGDNTYSNYKEARLAFWEDTVIPLLTLILDDWNAWFGQVYDGVRLEPDLDSVPAIVDKRYQLWEMADKSTDLTINERRELKGYEPLPNGVGDVILVSSSLIPLEFVVEEPQPVPTELVPVADDEEDEDPPVELTAEDIKALTYGGKYA